MMEYREFSSSCIFEGSIHHLKRKIPQEVTHLDHKSPENQEG